MRIPETEDPWNMDSKLKFSDRLKALLKTENRQDVDPYVFSEPEPFTSSGGANAKNLKLLASRNSRSVQNRSSKSKGKCINQRIKAEPVEASGSLTMSNSVLEGGASKNMNLRFPDAIQRKRKHADSLLRIGSTRPSRDHTLLYYPRAGDEISDSESSGEEATVYQRHWFNGETTEPTTRSTRLIQLRSQLRRRLIQLHKSGLESEASLRERARCLLQAAYRDPSSAARAFGDKGATKKYLEGPLLVGGPCGMEGCRQISLPCTRHCSRHIMMNGDQQLFEHCTAKFSDNTQCSIPVFDVAHELPLCPEHARKRDNYHRKAQQSKPKKSRKKPASPTVPTAPRPKPKSRPKKRKRPPAPSKPQEVKNPEIVVQQQQQPQQQPQQQQQHQNQPEIGEIGHRFVSQVPTENHTKTLNNLNAPQSTSNANMNLGLGLGGLGLGSGLKVELGDHEVFASLDPTEHDFGNVLNTLPADAFNDLFIESRNGEYEPSREEEEELERALEAVDKDVRTLERLGQHHGLLEPALLAQLMSDIAS
ncbi:INO80 complex subunit D [Belonocnema kinseyi]|uniref:INO80 complex subunit D n=1 Tax=Belonocnema kinseyi TaxID=2817044 RepID=UPI00143D99B5|nr:INO80 complex subunit D [Belonocnema kinseyi]